MNETVTSCRFTAGFTGPATNDTEKNDEINYALKVYHLAFFSSSYVIPLILISGLYLRMLSRLWRTVVGGNVSMESYRGRKRVTRLVVIVVAAFASLWFPIQVQ